LRGHAHLLQELSHFHVEDVLVHGFLLARAVGLCGY
jgi:hypothetical protein